MKPATQTLVLGLFLVALPAVAPSRAQACSCMAQTLEEAKQQACAVFEGVVTAVEPIADEAQGDIAGHGRVRVVLRVVQTWTPGLPEEVTVTTADNSAACGVHFEVGRGYLVFADGGVAEAPTVSLCGGTKAREDADKDIAALGMGVVPVSPSQRTATSSATARRGGCAGCQIGAARVVPAPWLALVFGAWVWALRRSAARTS